MTQPELATERLLLRPFTLADAPATQRLANDPEIAANTLTIPHPYDLEMAEAWIGQHAGWFERGEQIVFAATLREGGALVGAVGLVPTPQHARAELGYWVGRPFKGNGYCTEAARAVVEYGFRALELNRMQAHHFVHNPASGRVLRKIGMQREGRLRQYYRKADRYEDTELYAILRDDLAAGEGAESGAA